MHKAGKVVFRITNGSAFFVLETFTPNMKVFSIERRNYRTTAATASRSRCSHSASLLYQSVGSGQKSADQL